MSDSSTTNAPAAKPGCRNIDNLEKRIACLADAGPQAIEDRLLELDGEWSTSRVTKSIIGVLIVVGCTMAALHNPLWLVLPGIAGLFMLQYAFSCNSLLDGVGRAFGFRPGCEIEQERMALKVLRGDFRVLPTLLDIENHEDIGRLEGEGGITVPADEAKMEPIDAAKVALEATKF